MENKEKLAKLIKAMDNQPNFIQMRATSGDKTLRSILEGVGKTEYQQSTQEKSKGFEMPSEEFLEAIRKMQEDFDKTFHEDYMNGIYDKFMSGIFLDMDVSEKLDKKEDITGEAQLIHETVHCTDFGDYEQGTNQEETFSDDEVEYDEQLKRFIEFITFNKEFGDSTYVRVKREGNIISYSRIDQGIELDNHKIMMTKSDNLKELYGLLKVTFGPDFVYGCKHEMLGGWSLLPSIGDKLMIEINSDEPADCEWIFNEIHDRPPVIIDGSKKF